MRLAATSTLLALVCSVALALFPVSALAHAAFLGSTPGPGTRVDASPKPLSLTFTEGLDGTLATASLTAVRGRRGAPARVQVVGRRLLLTPSAPLATGAYVVRWHSGSLALNVGEVRVVAAG
jgi:methionine-rich copper-binding protein CopC